MSDTSIKIYERSGSFSNCWFKMRPFKTLVEPQEEQAKIIEQIKAAYNETGHTVVFLYGPPGTGKSMIGVLLASELGGSYCNTLRPWQPGDMLGTLYSEVEPTKEKPLILSFDEVDVALVTITAGIPDHKQLPTAIQNKTGWTRLMDEIGRGMYPNLILVMSSNRDPTFVNGLDDSYFREGRVDLIVGVNDKIERKKAHAS
jgi:DNA polymerase III delta prime subunit